MSEGEEQGRGPRPSGQATPASEGAQAPGPHCLSFQVFQEALRTSLRIRRKRGWRKRTEPQEEGRRRLPEANRATGLGEASL